MVVEILKASRQHLPSKRKPKCNTKRIPPQDLSLKKCSKSSGGNVFSSRAWLRLLANIRKRYDDQTEVSSSKSTICWRRGEKYHGIALLAFLSKAAIDFQHTEVYIKLDFNTRHQHYKYILELCVVLVTFRLLRRLLVSSGDPSSLCVCDVDDDEDLDDEDLDDEDLDDEDLDDENLDDEDLDDEDLDDEDLDDEDLDDEDLDDEDLDDEDLDDEDLDDEDLDDEDLDDEDLDDEDLDDEDLDDEDLDDEDLDDEDLDDEDLDDEDLDDEDLDDEDLDDEDLDDEDLDDEDLDDEDLDDEDLDGEDLDDEDLDDEDLDDFLPKPQPDADMPGPMSQDTLPTAVLEMLETSEDEEPVAKSSKKARRAGQ
ncbi:clumping factor A-like [Penaeus indicus]|uniref:clumping factor A-like n=1 Tax=Penaeus indicus TaxID=29960 RepID=UPI00300C295D